MKLTRFEKGLLAFCAVMLAVGIGLLVVAVRLAGVYFS